jgi:hypothetical protein
MAGGGEAEQIVGPVVDAENAFLIEVAHDSATSEPILPLNSFVSFICV